MKNLSYKIYVINMAQSTQRWGQISAMLDKLGLAYERVEGIDASKLSAQEMAAYYSFEKNRTQYPRPLKPGEIGCYISHIKCWQKIEEENLDFGVILEDDIVLSDKFPAAIDFLKAHFSEWNFVRLQEENKNRILYDEKVFSEFNLREFIRTSGCTWGYAVNLYTAMFLRLKCVPFGITVDSNMHFYHKLNIKTLCLFPPVVFAGKNSESCINTGSEKPKNFHTLARPAFSFRCYLGKILYFLKRDGLPTFAKNCLHLKKEKRFNGSIDFNVLYCANEKYAKFAAVSIISLLKNNGNYNVNVHLFESDFSENTKNTFLKIAEKFKNAALYFYKIDSDKFSKLGTSVGYISKEGYYRYLAGELIVDKNNVLYLDCDTIVNKDIGEIFSTDLNGYFCAAVADKYVMRHQLQKKLGLNGKYFNSGVLLFNLPEIRKGNAAKSLLEISAKNSFRFQDQDAINIFFKGTIRELPGEYNSVSKSALGAKIIHYVGPKKPHNSGEISIRKFKYKKYERLFNLLTKQAI